MSDLPVLLYHRIAADEAALAALPAEEQAYAVLLPHFRAQLEALAGAGYGARLPSVGQGWAPGSILLTFDDNCPSHLELAAPALEALGWRGLFLAVSGRLGGADALDEDALRALRARGHRVGSHSRTHAFLNLLDDEAVIEEVAGSREELALILGEEPEDFSVPGGRYDARTLVAAESAGYTRVFSSDRSAVGRATGGEAPTESFPSSFLHGRICVRRGWSPERLLAAVRGIRLPFEGLSERAKQALRNFLGDTTYDGAQRRLAALRAGLRRAAA